MKKDSLELASLMMPIDQLDRLREEARGDFETFNAITSDFAVERIMIEGDRSGCAPALAGAVEKRCGRSGRYVSEVKRDCSGSEHSRFFCAGFRAILPLV